MRMHVHYFLHLQIQAMLPTRAWLSLARHVRPLFGLGKPATMYDIYDERARAENRNGYGTSEPLGRRYRQFELPCTESELQIKM